MEGMKMETKDAWAKIDELKKHPELADTPGYEIDELRETVKPVYWFFLLMEQPQFACHCDVRTLTEDQIRRIRKRQGQLSGGELR